MISSPNEINRIIVQQLRLGHGPESLTKSDGTRALPPKWLHEGFAPEKNPYPLICWQRFPNTPLVYTWGSVMILARYDVRAYSRNSVEADNLAALIGSVLDEAQLVVPGQSTLICRRVADLRSPDVDEEGQKVYMAGGTWEVITDQPQPQLATGSIAADAVIV